MQSKQKFETKQDFTAWMHSVLKPLIPFYSEGRARLHLGETAATYPQVSIEMEAFSRPLWALVPYWMGGGQGFEEIYREGLENGTNPAHPEYWGGFTDYDQRFVEMAAIATGMIFAPQKVWEPLSGEAKQHLADWLYGINEYIIPECNWQFFMILVNVALKKRGCRYSEEKLALGLSKVESYYLRDGWYKDGESEQKDYYISFAMHYYGLLYAVAMADEDPARCQCFKDRAERFAEDFIYWFDADGAALPFGRSLTYRFGQGAFWSAYVFAGLNKIPVSVVKGILTRHLEWWSGQKIFDRDGVLSIGYAYPNLVMAERYNAPGSPYWGLKSLLCLALSDDHPFFTAPAEELPKLSDLRPIKPADMLMQRRGGEAIAYAAGVCQRAGHGHVWEKYAKFAYSTRFGFSVAKSQMLLHENAPDSMLSFALEGGDRHICVRKASDSHKVEEDRVVSQWSPFPGIRVSTTIFPKEYGHLRVHEIESDYDCMAYDCGFAVEKFVQGYVQQTDNGKAQVQNYYQSCTVSGEGPQVKGIVIDSDPNTNLLYPNASIPAVCYHIAKGKITRLKTRVESQIIG